MRRITAVLLGLCLLLTICPSLAVSALTDELLVNGDFEAGNASGFFAYGPSANTDFGDDYAHTGSYGMRVSARDGIYATYAQDIAHLLRVNGPGEYTASLWARLPAGGDGGSAKMQLVINILQDGIEKQYHTSAQAPLSGEWTEFVFTGTLDFDPEKDFSVALIYPQYCDTASNLAPDFCLDDVSLRKISEVNGIPDEDAAFRYDPAKPLTPIEDTAPRSEITSVGAIRWDAWYTHDGNPTSVISQVERSLSPAEYHYRTPFFGEITEDGKVIIPAYTQEVFDREMVYAADAGIDYFAYVWYNDDMRAARDFHLTSAYANDVKMAACLDGNAIGKDYARREITALFSQDLYMTVSGGRPLMYYFGEAGNLAAIRDDINYYRQYCESVGLPVPYAVILNVDGKSAVAYGADASSTYAVGGSSTYTALAAAAKRDWNARLRDGVPFVPSVTCGWSPKPRFDNPVSWTTVPENSWSEDATPDELYAHLTEALRYMQGAKVSSATNSNTVLIYAWNEHDEGGWICPTLAVDENGAQLYDDNGQKQINDERIRSTKRAITDFKARMTGQSDTTPADTTVPTPDTSAVTTSPMTALPQGTAVDGANPATSSDPSVGGCQSLVGPSVCLALAAGGVCLLRRRRDF